MRVSGPMRESTYELKLCEGLTKKKSYVKGDEPECTEQIPIFIKLLNVPCDLSRRKSPSLLSCFFKTYFAIKFM